MSTSLFNCRMEDELLDAIDARAEEAGLKKSTWAREVMGAVALGGVTLEELAALVEAKGRADQSPHPERHLTLQGTVGRQSAVARVCVHPMAGHIRLAFSIRCGVCGQTVKRT